MPYAWAIDQTKCIGCHACSTACKSENDVPLGVYRTWVKNVEVGVFPETRRHFAVLRCNNCEEPPCVDICPVRAMYQRDDGIVDLDHDRCIGCKACMQACPYDAIHIDPTDQTAAKCHSCAHRVDQGLLPACVVVCPVEALVFGDMDDPTSRVHQILGSSPVTVRRPEQGTKPKAFYIGAHEATLDPLAARHEGTYMWAEGRPEVSASGDRSGVLDARVAYDVSHPIVWQKRVSAYLWTKSIAAGTAFLAALGLATGRAYPDRLLTTGAPLIAMLALVVTGVLLIADLKRPDRFWYIMLKPQWTSWLTRGAYIILVFGIGLAGWLVSVSLHLFLPSAFFYVTAAAALFTAVYTAWLFDQCEARDLWQSPMLALHLGVQMLVAGSATLLVVTPILSASSGNAPFLVGMLGLALVAHLLMALTGEVAARHGSTNARAAAHQLVGGRYATLFWGALAGGGGLPLVVLALGGPVVPASAAALVGLAMYEHAFVMAGQSVPIS